jgi:hypothetical protein
MRVIDAVLDSFSLLFRFHRYSPLEKLYSAILFMAGLSLRDLSERFSLTGASRGYRQVDITSSPPTLMMLCIAAIAVTSSSKLFNVYL